jgi:hypothetical protein
VTDTTPEQAAGFRMRPFEVRAAQWTGDNLDEVYDLTGSENFDVLSEQDRANCDDPQATAMVFARLHNSTWKLVRTGDWIIKGTKGEFFPLPDEVFREAYEDATSEGAERASLRVVLAIIEGLDEPGPVADLIRVEVLRGLGEHADADETATPGPEPRAALEVRLRTVARGYLDGSEIDSVMALADAYAADEVKAAVEIVIHDADRHHEELLAARRLVRDALYEMGADIDTVSEFLRRHAINEEEL